MIFNDTVASVAEAQKRDDPLTIARKYLAPVRRHAVASLEEFTELTSRLRPVFENASDKVQRAATVRARNYDLESDLKAAYEMMHPANGVAASLQSLIDWIDAFTPWQAFQQHHRDAAGQLQLRRAGIGALEALAKNIPWQVSQLEELLERRAPNAPAPVMTITPPEAPPAPTQGHVGHIAPPVI
jgi:hypothetical protein